MYEYIRKLFGKSYEPLNKITISRERLLANYAYVSSIDRNIHIAPVLKSNAYGHGIQLVGKVLDKVNPPFFCVDSIYEGYELLKAGIKTPILIMGYIDPVNLRVKKLPFSYAVYNKEQLEAISTFQKGSGIHIKVDTGMHRLGVTLEDLPEFVKLIRSYSDIKVEGLMSHFAESEEPESGLTRKQIQNYLTARDILNNYGFTPKYYNFPNSSGILNARSMRLGDFTNLARVGLDIYGIDLQGKDTKLRPVLTLTTKIVQIKELVKGDRVGYNGTFTAKKNMRMAVLPIGFYDGVDRRLSNKGTMIIDGVECPIIGRVSMNITTIDISNVLDPFIGQEVTVFSNDPTNKNSIYQSAKIADTTPYDLLVHLAASTRREVV